MKRNKLNELSFCCCVFYFKKSVLTSCFDVVSKNMKYEEGEEEEEESILNMNILFSFCINFFWTRMNGKKKRQKANISYLDDGVG